MNVNRTAAGLILVAVALLFGGLAWAQAPIPPLKARVTDLTGTLTPAQQSTLEQKLGAFEARKGSQIALLIVPSTEGEAIAEYGVRVFDQWKLGRKGINDGALLLIAKQDRTLWIVVGRGLEGVLPDITAKRIVSEVIVPLFKHGDFYGGIDAGLERMIKVVDGEPLPPPQQRAYNESDWAAALPLAILIAFVSGAIFRAIFGRFPGSLAAGGLTGFVTWLVIGALGVAGLAALLAFIFNLFAGVVATPTNWSSRGRHSGWGGGGWGGGGWGGGWGGGGGGGWSGGGGDTAGGGAGGSW